VYMCVLHNLYRWYNMLNSIHLIISYSYVAFGSLVSTPSDAFPESLGNTVVRRYHIWWLKALFWNTCSDQNCQVSRCILTVNFPPACLFWWIILVVCNIPIKNITSDLHPSSSKEGGICCYDCCLHSGSQS